MNLNVYTEGEGRTAQYGGNNLISEVETEPSHTMDTFNMVGENRQHHLFLTSANSACGRVFIRTISGQEFGVGFRINIGPGAQPINTYKIKVQRGPLATWDFANAIPEKGDKSFVEFQDCSEKKSAEVEKEQEGDFTLTITFREDVKAGRPFHYRMKIIVAD